MADVLRLPPVPRAGDMFVDARGEDRTMRVSLHPERGTVVVSLWSGTTCRASFQLPLDEAARLANLVCPSASEPEFEPGHPYPGLPDHSDHVHVTGTMVLS